MGPREEEHARVTTGDQTRRTQRQVGYINNKASAVGLIAQLEELPPAGRPQRSNDLYPVPRKSERILPGASAKEAEQKQRRGSRLRPSYLETARFGQGLSPASSAGARQRREYGTHRRGKEQEIKYQEII